MVKPVEQITLRGPSAELVRRLKKLSQDRGQSLNQTVLSLLESATGINPRLEALKKYMTWTQEEGESFDRELALLRRMDDTASEAGPK